MHLTKALLLVVVFSFATGCSSGTGMRTAADMKKSLDAEIPAGTSVAVAESKLKARGFSVSHVARSSVPSTQPAESLHAEMTEGGIVLCKWNVAVFARRNAVVRIDVQQWLTGP